MNRYTVVVVSVVAALVLAACGSDKKPASLSPTESKTVTVTTLAQVKDVATKLAALFQHDHPGVTVTVTADTAGGITASVAKKTSEVAIATSATLKRATGSFGRDLAVIAVAAANPHHVANVKVFAANSGLKTAVCGETTSLGDFTVAVLTRSGVTPAPGTVHAGCEAKSVQQVAAGTLDAVLLFRTGVVVPKGVKLLDVDAKANIILPLSYLAVGGAGLTVEFGKFLATAPARQVLTENGYLP